MVCFANLGIIGNHCRSIAIIYEVTSCLIHKISIDAACFLVIIWNRQRLLRIVWWCRWCYIVWAKLLLLRHNQLCTRICTSIACFKRISIYRKHVGSLHQASPVLDNSFTSIMLVVHMSILGNHWTWVVCHIVLRLMRLMRHSQFYVCKVTMLNTSICILLLVIVLSRWWMTSFVTFDLLFKFILPDKTLMLRCVIIVWENLRQ